MKINIKITLAGLAFALWAFFVLPFLLVHTYEIERFLACWFLVWTWLGKTDGTALGKSEK